MLKKYLKKIYYRIFILQIIIIIILGEDGCNEYVLMYIINNMIIWFF